ncbi:MAG TPA: RNA polymerase factor sigma-54, partial [Saprospiraceae bacterium]|nr:RNA polymerase factor sigma-54 [Saprospiraceae bacterium]
LKILPQQIQFLNLLHLNQHELEQYIQKEIDENPFLEEYAEPADSLDSAIGADADPEGFDDDFSTEVDYDDPLNWGSMDDETPDYALKTETGFADEDPWQSPAIQGITVREDIKEQARFLPISERQRTLLDYLIDSLDDYGFLSTPVEDLSDDISFSLNLFVEEKELVEVLRILQSFDPVGIGARNLKECLLIQIDRIAEESEMDVDVPRVLVRDYMEALAAHQYDVIRRQLDLDSDELREALDFIVSLNPRPLRGFADTQAQQADIIQPEYVVESDGDDLIVSLSNSRGGSVRIQSDAEQSLKSTRDKTAKQFISKKLQDAQWLVDALQQRDDTMLRTMRTLVMMQRDFFQSGDYKKLKPMTLRDVAAYTDLDPSTISRVTSTKHIQTSFGIIPAKDLFTQTFTSKDGRELSNTDVMDCLKELVDQEDKQQPYNDTELCKLLEQRGFPVARRTVAKYRDVLEIPAAEYRKAV